MTLIHRRYSTLKCLLFTLAMSFFGNQLYSQPLPINFTGGRLDKFPIDLQLYGRNLSTNLANVQVEGVLDNGTPPTYKEVRLFVYRDADNDDSYTPSELVHSASSGLLVYPPGQQASFALSYQLPAELVNYKFELLGVTQTDTEELLADAEQVVAGDAFIIMGQSNAEASRRGGGTSNDQPFRKFVRVYGSGNEDFDLVPRNWGIGDGDEPRKDNYNTGMWAMQLSNLIAEEHGIPICILNGATGGNGFSVILPAANRTSLSTFYGRLLTRAIESGLQNSIRAAFLYQGESDAGIYGAPKLTQQQYIDAYTTLRAAWQLDYPAVQNVFLFQVRFGCSMTNIDHVLPIMEAQRQIALNNPEVDIISTSNADQFYENPSLQFCHYRFQDGHQRIGTWASYIVSQRLYNAPYSNNTVSPEPTAAYFSEFAGGFASQITINLAKQNDTYALNGDIKPDFRLEGGSYTINSITLNGFRIIVNFTRNAGTNTDPSGITHMGHTGIGLPSISNANGLGLVTFNNLPITSDPLPLDPLQLTVTSSGYNNILRWNLTNLSEIHSFIVERKNEQNEFVPLTEIILPEDAQQGVQSYIDNKPLTKVNQYRIRAIRVNGTELLSHVVTVSNRLILPAELIVYPNPVISTANASVFMRAAGLATIEVFTITGTRLSSRTLQLMKGRNQFSMGELLDFGRGTFIVRVSNSSESYQIKVVKL